MTLWLQRTSGRVMMKIDHASGPVPDSLEHDGQTWRRSVELPSLNAVVYHPERRLEAVSKRSA